MIQTFFGMKRKRRRKSRRLFAFNANAQWLPLLSDIGHQRNAEALTLYCLDDADDDQTDEANPDGAEQ